VSAAKPAAAVVVGKLVAPGHALDGATVKLLHRGRTACLVQIVAAPDAPTRVGERLTVGDVAFKQEAR